MSELPRTIIESRIWSSTLGGASTEDPRASLIAVFKEFRERAAHLATKIQADLPDLTVHDVTHLDALWEIASTIVGGDVQFTPTEAFVLGGAFLLHDLAMSVAAIPGGIEAISRDPKWIDHVYAEYQRLCHRAPVASEIANPTPEVRRGALFQYLRRVHAERAEVLASQPVSTNDGSDKYLIENERLRHAFGGLIGRIARSHWWPVSELARHFPTDKNPPPGFPRDWKVDPLKLACILRLADAAHLDARRAPMFLRAISDLTPSSEQYWRFQEKLDQVGRENDALTFTSSVFNSSEASAWWLCYDALCMVDGELRRVDALLAADPLRRRFAARRVAGVDLPERLVEYVLTDGWLPVDAKVHVSDLPLLIKTLGGDELYGQNPQIVIRELVQNACDAIRARRTRPGHSTSFGQVIVALKDDDGPILEVTDNGIGMSRRVLTESLLDFGHTFWGSSEMLEEIPGLLSSSFRATGKYGIGFFSVFMVTDKLQISTRRWDSALSDTLVLEFGSGLAARPILRPAHVNEQLADAGTRVRLWLRHGHQDRGGLLNAGYVNPSWSLGDVCQHLCPAIDVDLFVQEDNEAVKIVTNRDWQKVDGEELVSRIHRRVHGQVINPRIDQVLRKQAAQNLRPLIDDTDNIVGRAAITYGQGFPGYFHQSSPLQGVVTVGGLRACEINICGVLVGEPQRASRDAAEPIVSAARLKVWAEEQADLVPLVWEAPEDQAACAQSIRLCGGYTKNLPIASYQKQWVSAKQIAEMVDIPDTVIIVDNYMEHSYLARVGDYSLHDNVFVTIANGITHILHTPAVGPWPDLSNCAFIRAPRYSRPVLELAGAVIESLATAWRVAYSAIAAANSLEAQNDVEFGMVQGNPYRHQGIIVSKPTVPSI